MVCLLEIINPSDLREKLNSCDKALTRQLSHVKDNLLFWFGLGFSVLSKNVVQYGYLESGFMSFNPSSILSKAGRPKGRVHKGLGSLPQRTSMQCPLYREHLASSLPSHLLDKIHDSNNLKEECFVWLGLLPVSVCHHGKSNSAHPSGPESREKWGPGI